MTHATLPTSEIVKAARASMNGCRPVLSDRLRTLWLLASAHEAALHREMVIDLEDFALIAEPYARAQGWSVPSGPAKP